MLFKKRLALLRALFQRHNIDGYVVPSYDEFGNEFTPAHLKRLEWLSGFSGSHGIFIVMRDSAFFFTDSRYLLQARQQLGEDVIILDMYDHAACDRMTGIIASGSVVGYDPMIESIRYVQYYEKLAKASNFRMHAIEKNLVDLIWSDKKQPKLQAIEYVAAEHSGLSHSEKIAMVLAKMHKSTDYLFIHDLTAIAWMLNVRGHDIQYSPIFLAYAFLKKDGKCFLFTDVEFAGELEHVIVHKIREMKNFFIDLVIAGNKIQADRDAAVWFAHIAGDQINITEDPVSVLKGCKNQVEIQNIRKVHCEDALALARFFCWLHSAVETSVVTEIDAAEKLLAFRTKSKHFIYPSFATISAFGANGAIIHYNPDRESNQSITKSSLYLVDSGGQYRYGTTDVTRTFCFGVPSTEQKKSYTLVLKGMLRLSMMLFPVGTNGAQLDGLARYDLWQHGLEYGHGTGHGVGYFLSVHEGPHKLSKAGSVVLRPGMVVSNEPGYYQDGEYGIRIENVMLVKASGVAGFLEFETLTLAPIAVNLIDFSSLSEGEKKWLMSYNDKVYDTVSEYLTVDERKQLQRICEC